MEIDQIYQLFIASKGLSTDTRNINKGQLFFALKGDNFNGNEYAAQALKDGASFSIIDEEKYNTSDHIILVDDVLKTLQDLAHFHREQFDIPVIGITGTNGKTTTKELIHAALSTQYNVHYTKGNFNNHIGVPLTLLAMKSDTQIAIIEMGANHIGEIETLCNIANPNYGIITNCGKAHIEGFGSEENIKIAKGELYKHIKNKDGQLFVNNHLDYLMQMSDGIKRTEYQNLEVLISSPKLKLKSAVEMEVQLIGRYNIPNISAAYAIAKFFDISEEKIKSGLESYIPAGLNRSELRDYKGATIILDAYNANPSSMKVALESFNEEAYNSKMVILGDMFELGETSNKEHQNILVKLSELSFDGKVVVGENFNCNNCDEDIIAFKSTYELKAWFDTLDIEGLSILIKGSRGMKLESILES